MKNVLIVVNSTEEDFDSTDLELRNISFTKLYAISHKSGRKLQVKYEVVEDKVSIKTKNFHLTTQTVILE